MKSLIIREIDEKNIQELLNAIYDNDELIIYIDSSGGECSLFSCLLHAMNAKENKITLIACGDLSSMAFALFFSFYGMREILPYVTAHLHYSGNNPRVMVNGNMEYDEDIQFSRIFKDQYQKEKAFFSKLLDKTTMTKLENGDSVLLGASQLIQILIKQSETH